MKILFVIFTFFSSIAFAQSDFTTVGTSLIRERLKAENRAYDNVVLNSTMNELKTFLMSRGATSSPDFCLDGSTCFLRGLFTVAAFPSPYRIYTNESFFSLSKNGYLMTGTAYADYLPPRQLLSWNYDFAPENHPDGALTMAKPSNYVYSSKVGQPCISGCTQFPPAPARANFTVSFNGEDFSVAGRPTVQITVACDDIRNCADAEIKYFFWRFRMLGFSWKNPTFVKRELNVSGDNYVFNYAYAIDIFYNNVWMNMPSGAKASTYLPSPTNQLSGTITSFLSDSRFDNEFVSLSDFAGWFSTVWRIASLDTNYKGEKISSYLVPSDYATVTTPVYFRSLVEPISLFIQCDAPKVVLNNVCVCELPNSEVNGVCTVPSSGGGTSQITPYDISGAPLYSPPPSGSSSGGGGSGTAGTGTMAWLGADPQTPLPTLEDVPTSDSIISKVFTLIPTFKNLSLSHASATCPKFETLEFWGRVFVFDQHCALSESARQMISTFSVLAFSIMALFIVLKA